LRDGTNKIQQQQLMPKSLSLHIFPFLIESEFALERTKTHQHLIDFIAFNNTVCDEDLTLRCYY
jgi:hypothetical protein